MTPLTPDTPQEAWIVEICVAGREWTGPWRIELSAHEEQAKERALRWNADRPAGYSHRAVRYVRADT